MKSPIFLFSLPRAGSTLLQRMLMSHPQIASVAEPWIMLPFCYAFKSTGTVSEYSHITAFTAIEDFVDNLPSKEEDYFDALACFASTLYEKQCKNNEFYFLDKTPRYYLIIPEILKTFPKAKFIFLFRNPIHIMGSMMETWGDGGFRRMYNFEEDLNSGPEALSHGYELLGDKAIAIQYEQLVMNPLDSITKICKYLEIDVANEMLESFSKSDTKGRMGDVTGRYNYKSVSTDSLCKWEKTFSTNFRKKIAIKYINSIDESVLRIQGYEKNDILKCVENISAERSGFLVDWVDFLYSDLVRCSKANIYFGKLTSKWARKRFLS